MKINLLTRHLSAAFFLTTLATSGKVYADHFCAKTNSDGSRTVVIIDNQGRSCPRGFTFAGQVNLLSSNQIADVASAQVTNLFPTLIKGIPQIKGDVGPQGPTGPAGARGEKGDKGDRGEVGPVGSQGERGLQGVAGIQGVAGPKGDRGDIGLRGPAGENGLQGEKGDRGDQGPVGPKGDTGAIGPVGPVGPKGDKGEAGQNGTMSATEVMSIVDERLLSPVFYTPYELEPTTLDIRKGANRAVALGYLRLFPDGVWRTRTVIKIGAVTDPDKYLTNTPPSCDTGWVSNAGNDFSKSACFGTLSGYPVSAWFVGPTENQKFPVMRLAGGGYSNVAVEGCAQGVMDPSLGGSFSKVLKTGEVCPFDFRAVYSRLVATNHPLDGGKFTVPGIGNGTRFANDVPTQTRLCELYGYGFPYSASAQEFDSCGNNHIVRWNTGIGWQTINACDYNSGLTSLVCVRVK